MSNCQPLLVSVIPVFQNYTTTHTVMLIKIEVEIKIKLKKKSRSKSRVILASLSSLSTSPLDYFSNIYIWYKLFLPSPVLAYPPVISSVVLQMPSD